MSNPNEFLDTSDPRCPYCHDWTDDWEITEISFDQYTQFRCSRCGKKYLLVMNVSFDSKGNCELNEQKHHYTEKTFVAQNAFPDRVHLFCTICSHIKAIKADKAIRWKKLYGQWNKWEGK